MIKIRRKFHTLTGLTILLGGILLGGCETQQSSSQSNSTPQTSSSSSSSSSTTSSSSSTSSGASSSSSSSSTSSSGTQSSASGSPAMPGSDASGSADFPETASSDTYGSPEASSGSQPTDDYGDASTTAGGDSSAAGEVLSDEEYVAVLEGELDNSMSDFDGMILDQRTTIEGMEDAYSGDGFPEQGEGGGGSDEPLFEEGDLASEQEGVVPGMPGAKDQSQGSGTEESGNSAEGGVTGGNATGDSMEGKVARSESGVPADIPDGRDDDIVARQIREAAMKEKDPVLREKLWDEYRKYKNQSK